MYKKIAAVGTGLLAIGSSAFAELPTEVTGAMTSAQTDGVKLAGLALVVIIAIGAFKYMRKAV